MNLLRIFFGIDIPMTASSARARLTALWFIVFALNVLIVFVILVFGGFGGAHEVSTQRSVLDALQSVFHVFSVELSLVATYWYSLRAEGSTPLASRTAFLISWYASLLWSLILTGCHVLLRGFVVYSETLPRIGYMGHWLVAGALSYYFAKGSAGNDEPVVS